MHERLIKGSVIENQVKEACQKLSQLTYQDALKIMSMTEFKNPLIGFCSPVEFINKKGRREFRDYGAVSVENFVNRTGTTDAEVNFVRHLVEDPNDFSGYWVDLVCEDYVIAIEPMPSREAGWLFRVYANTKEQYKERKYTNIDIEKERGFSYCNGIISQDLVLQTEINDFYILDDHYGWWLKFYKKFEKSYDNSVIPTNIYSQEYQLILRNSIRKIVRADSEIEERSA